MNSAGLEETDPPPRHISPGSATEGYQTCELQGWGHNGLAALQGPSGGCVWGPVSQGRLPGTWATDGLITLGKWRRCGQDWGGKGGPYSSFTAHSAHPEMRSSPQGHKRDICQGTRDLQNGGGGGSSGLGMLQEQAWPPLWAGARPVSC